MNITWVVRDSAGAETRLLRLPEDMDPAPQLQPGETASRERRVQVAAVPEVPPPVTEELLLATIDAQREANQMAVMTAGRVKDYVYNRKAAEAADACGVGSAVLNALDLTEKNSRFPFASAESALTGEALSVVLARFEDGEMRSLEKIAAIEAQAQKAKRAVRAASTIAAKQAAANIQWSA